MVSFGVRCGTSNLLHEGKNQIHFAGWWGCRPGARPGILLFRRERRTVRTGVREHWRHFRTKAIPCPAALIDPAGRIQFYRPNGETQNQVAHGSVILGVKVDRDLFKLSFNEMGPCMTACERLPDRRQKERGPDLQNSANRAPTVQSSVIWGDCRITLHRSTLGFKLCRATRSRAEAGLVASSRPMAETQYRHSSDAAKVADGRIDECRQPCGTLRLKTTYKRAPCVHFCVLRPGFETSGCACLGGQG